MKTRFLAILALTAASAFSMNAWSQTADDGSGPTEQPSSPMEAGPGPGQSPYAPGPNAQGPDNQPYDNQPDAQPNDAQPTEAQPGGPTGEAPATTDQGVARVSLIHGEVSTQRGDSGDWSAATLNQPVMGGDKVSTGNDSRAEMQLDFANTVRLGPNSQANVATLTKKNIQIQLSQGIANYSVSKDSEAEPEIDTPNVSVHPAHHDGVFRIEVRPDGDTVVIVRKGEAQIATPQGSTEVRAGEMATVRGSSEEAQYKISDAPDRDDWDRWNADRDHMIENAQAYHHTNRYYTGAQDLDAYGQWKSVPDYGDVWVPNEPDGWAPYRDGSWVWEPYYGWTWVGYEPWGWAPYHYGRWLPYGASWAWWPGPVYGGGFYRPFWAPAYVSFWGWGGGFGFGVGFGFGGWGGFGWLPLGPCDWFHPWWGGYGHRFGWVGHGWEGGRFGGIAPLHGGSRFSNVANIHDNHVFRGMSTVGARSFGNGRVTAMAASRSQLNGAHMMAGNLPVVPTHASLSASGRAAAPSTIHNTGSQHFFGAHNNMARPASFQQQTASLRQSMAQSHVGAIPAGGRSSFSNASRGNGSMQKPSAGSFGAREMNNSGTRAANMGGQNTNRSFAAPNNNRSSMGSASETGRNSMSNRVSSNSGGFRPFTPPSSSNRSSNMGSASGANQRSAESSRYSNMGPASGESQRSAEPSRSNSSGGFRPFTPPPSSSASRGSQYSAPASRGSSGSYWNRTAPSSMSSGSRSSYGGYSSGSYGRGSSYSRPQLDMRQPIVHGPSYGGYSGSRGAPSYGGSRAPSYGGSRAPSYGGGHYSAPSGGGHYSAPSGGGHSYGGGGGHSGGGGGHSGGGGGHSGGGGHGGHR